MYTCTFFGHRDAPDAIANTLKEHILYLIEQKSVHKFYIGNHGHFDFLARTILAGLKKQYDFIDFYVVLAYLPSKTDEFDLFDYSKTIYPDGIENTPLRFAIDFRNRWMIEQSNYVITYTINPCGGASKYKTLSKKKNKIVIELSDIGN